MGVRGLQTYIENYCQSACIEVYITQLVINYTRETGNQNPVIVVDGSSCLNPFYGDLEWVTGGQMKQYAENLVFFVTQFQKIGVKLVFFFDGPTVNRKRATWVQRRINSMYNVYKILDMITGGKKTTEIDRSLLLMPASINFITQQILQNECGCEVHTSVVECDEEIADYARKNKCFAVLSQDSDFLIYEGDHLYLSVTHLDVKTMKTICYNRYELALRLQIEMDDLPLLASLMGNDVISADDLKPFHRDVVRRFRGVHAKPQYPILFPCVAEYVRRSGRGDLLLRSLPDIAQYIFGDKSKADLILTSLQSYSSAAFKGPVRNNEKLTGWDWIVEEAKFRHMTNYFPPMIYSLLIGLPFESSTIMEDYRRKDIRPSASVLRPLRQRIYGILFHEKPSKDGSQAVKELCMEGPGSLDEEKLIMPVSPRVHHPGLLVLWTSQSENDIAKRWELFVKSVSTKLEVEKIKCLPEQLILPALILCYLTEESVLKDWEIDAILATAVVLEEYSTKRLSELPKDPVSVRAIRIAPLILRSRSAVTSLSAVCGYPMNQKYSTPCTFFDGKLFQLKYRDAGLNASVLELCDNNVKFVDNFQQVKSVISAVNV